MIIMQFAFKVKILQPSTSINIVTSIEKPDMLEP